MRAAEVSINRSFLVQIKNQLQMYQKISARIAAMSNRLAKRAQIDAEKKAAAEAKKTTDFVGNKITPKKSKKKPKETEEFRMSAAIALDLAELDTLVKATLRELTPYTVVVKTTEELLLEYELEAARDRLKPKI